MNRIQTAAVVLALVITAIPVLTQGQAPGATTTPPNVAMPREVAIPALVQNPPRATDADARACLELATNAEIIRCAEKFLPRKRGT